MRIMFVVHAIPEFEMTGTPIAAWRLIKKLNSKGIAVGVISACRNGILGKTIVEGIPVYQLPGVNILNNYLEDHLMDRTDYLRYFNAAIQEFNPDILHVFNFVHSTYQILKIKEKYPNIKIIRNFTNIEDVCFCISPIIDLPNNQFMTCSGPTTMLKCAEHYNKKYQNSAIGETVKKMTKHLMYLEKIQQKYISNYIFTTESFKNHIAQFIYIPEDKIRIIPHGVINPIIQSTITNSLNINILFSGGTTTGKGLNLLLKAIKINEIIKGINLTVVGMLLNNELRRELQNFKLQYPQNITILGLIKNEDLMKIIPKQDLVVLPTYTETYNIFMRESLAAGVPVITTMTHGSSIIIDGENGFKFHVGDYIALHSAIESIYHNRDLLSKLKEGAKKTLVPTIDDECETVISLYKENE